MPGAAKIHPGFGDSVIQRASSLVFDTVEAKKQATRGRAKGELFYGRRGTLTHFSLQEAMCELEGGAGCALFPCGAAAVANTLLAFVEQGDHVLITNTAYEQPRTSVPKFWPSSASPPAGSIR
ncbi:Cystathionine beta-lyase [Pseudescherichia vulneris]|nr:Cystathionine beta-lyase [Pseudescherichia vulneris]